MRIPLYDDDGDGEYYLYRPRKSITVGQPRADFTEKSMSRAEVIAIACIGSGAIIWSWPFNFVTAILWWFAQ